MDGYLGMDLNGLGDIVEYIGGVEVDIPQEIENGGSYLPKGRYPVGPQLGGVPGAGTPQLCVW